MSESLVSFKDMCAKFDVTPRTLRYYEYIELLSPKREGRTRMYTPRDVARMKLIMRGRRWGFSLEELRQWLLIYDNEGTMAQLKAWMPLAAEKKAELERKQKEIAVVLDELNAMMANVQADLDKA